VTINSRSEENINKALEKLSKYKGQLLALPGNVSNSSFLEGLFDKTVEHFGRVDIWINCAGLTNEYKQTYNVSFENIKNVFDVNIYATVTGTIVAYNKMEKQGFGKIFNFEGLGSDGRIINKLSIYGTSKRAVNYFTKAFAREIDDSKVQIGVIQPGMVLTDLLMKPMEENTEEELKRFKKVFNLLGNKVEVVTPWISDKILKSNKNYDRIKYSSTFKILKNLVTNRKII